MKGDFPPNIFHSWSPAKHSILMEILTLFFVTKEEETKYM